MNDASTSFAQRRPPELWLALRDAIQAAYAPRERLGTMERLPSPGHAADDATKVLVRNAEGRPIGVLSIANPAAPGLIARTVQRTAEAKALLGAELGSVVLDPVLHGENEGLSYAVFPWRHPLSDSRWFWPIQRAVLRPAVLGWLRKVAQALSTGEIELEGDFLAPLRLIEGATDLSAPVREEARKAAERLRAGAWRPRLVFAHNDVWRGNILLARGAPKRYPLGRAFVLIDWAGMNARGYPFCDLVHFSRNFRLPAAGLRAEVDAHCRLLSCEREDAKGYVLAGLGYLGAHLEGFPRPLYLELVEHNFRKLTSAMESA